MVPSTILQFQALGYAATKITEVELAFHPSSFTDKPKIKSLDKSEKKASQRC